MKKLLIAIALLSACLFNAEAGEQQSIERKPVQAPSLYEKVKERRDSLKQELEKLIDKADGYIAQLKTVCTSKATLADLDTVQAKQAIKKYEEGVKFVDIINPYPEFNAPVEVFKLRERLKVAPEVQKAYALLKCKYTDEESSCVSKNLYTMYNDKSLAEEMRDECYKAGVALADDFNFRQDFIESLKKMSGEYGVIPTATIAAQARDYLINDFVQKDKYFPGEENVPETYALVHKIIAEMTNTLTNYTGLFISEGEFKKWVDGFVDQLSTEK